MQKYWMYFKIFNTAGGDFVRADAVLKQLVQLLKFLPWKGAQYKKYRDSPQVLENFFKKPSISNVNKS